LKFFEVGAANYDGKEKLADMVRFKNPLLARPAEIEKYWRNLGLVGIQLIDF